MGRVFICEKTGMKKGTWTAEEDRLLSAYVRKYGHWNWRELPRYAGLSRCGKSCRLRWMNYLRPNIRRGSYTREEEQLILDLHEKHGNRWSRIAASLPGRTDNEIKNYWHTHLKKRSAGNTIPKEAKEKHVRHETPRKNESFNNLFPPGNITPQILESSSFSCPMSPPKSHDFSSSSNNNESVMEIETTNENTATSSELNLESVRSFGNYVSFFVESIPEHITSDLLYSVPPQESHDLLTFENEVISINSQVTDEALITYNQVTGEVLFDPMSPQKSDDFSSFIMDGEAFVTDQVTDDGAISSDLSLEFYEKIWTDLLLIESMPDDNTSILVDPSLLSPLGEAILPYGLNNCHGRKSFLERLDVAGRRI